MDRPVEGAEEQLRRLLGIMAKLRSPGGCPWDREQTATTLRKYVLEEAYEVADAIDGGDPATLRDELGDLLLQVVFQARVAEEAGQFAFEDVARAIGDKLVRRHPHVFGDFDAQNVEAVWKKWEQIKADERAAAGRSPEQAGSRLDGIPKALPALPKARLIADKAARAGFDWPDADAIVDKIEEELGEIREALARAANAPHAMDAVCEEIGDLLFATASLARRLGVDPDGCLEGANRKFAARFRTVEALARERGLALEELTPGQIDALWNEAKGA